MATGQRVNNVPFEDLFDPDVTGDGPAAPGYRDSLGRPLRFAHIQYGSRGPDTGRRAPGVGDLAALWAAKGTARYALEFDGRGYYAGSQAPTNATGQAEALLQLTLLANGTWTISRSVANSIGNNGTETLTSGTWLPSGHAATDYQVLYSGAVAGGGLVNNGATQYQTLSLGRSYSLGAKVPAQSSTSMETGVQLLCELRRISTGQITRSTVGFSCMAMGWY